jgi:hypothetical protein
MDMDGQGDSQSQANAAGIVAARLFDPIKRVENANETTHLNANERNSIVVSYARFLNGFPHWASPRNFLIGLPTSLFLHGNSLFVSPGNMI